MYKHTYFGPTKTSKTIDENGMIHFKNNELLREYPIRFTDRLVHWAIHKPNETFIARKVDGEWVKLSYAEVYKKSKQIAQFLLNLNFQDSETVVILSENSLENALLVLASVHVGITYCPISPPYSLVSEDLEKLKHCLQLMTPKVVFVQSSTRYSKAITFIHKYFPEIIILSVDEYLGFKFDDIFQTEATLKVDLAYKNITEDTIAKVLFTSGSTGLPKGVMNHHGMWCANLQQITQCLPFMETQPPIFIDWLPWNHTFGSNHNFGLALFHGGTFYIDDGKPNQKEIETTVQNLREISPTAYFNVPKGFEMLIPYLEKEKELRQNFFKNLQILFYAGASLAQPIWNKLEGLAFETVGHKVPIITGLGCTESGPSAMFANWGGAFSGLLGVPVAGMDVKLVPDGDKLEARYKATNVTKGYWRNQIASQVAFDEEGYYKTGDAVKFLDDNNPDKGLIFDGRIAEDFKLSTGTWVNVGVLKAKAISCGSPIIQDIVFTGLNEEFIGAILFLNSESCLKLSENKDIILNQKVNEFLDNWLITINLTSTGSSNEIKKFIVATEPPSIDKGEITDKGSINQRMVLKHRKQLVDEMYAQ